MRRSRATSAPRCADFGARCGSVRRDTASNINEARLAGCLGNLFVRLHGVCSMLCSRHFRTADELGRQDSTKLRRISELYTSFKLGSAEQYLLGAV